MNRKRYLISWKLGDDFGREIWVMERRGKLSPGDIKFLEKDIARKWGKSKPVIITNFQLVN